MLCYNEKFEVELSLKIVLWQSSIGLLDFRCYLHDVLWSFTPL